MPCRACGDIYLKVPAPAVAACELFTATVDVAYCLISLRPKSVMPGARTQTKIQMPDIRASVEPDVRALRESSMRTFTGLRSPRRQTYQLLIFYSEYQGPCMITMHDMFAVDVQHAQGDLVYLRETSTFTTRNRHETR